MDPTVFSAVLFSAFFQAGWNFSTKKSRANKIALLAVGWFLFGIVLLPVACARTAFDAFNIHWIFYLCASGLIHAVYICLLGWAYSIGEISVVYPVARGLGIVGTAAASIALSLHGISTFGLTGIGSVVAGTILIGLQEFPHRHRRQSFQVALLVATAVAGYSVVDSFGAKEVPHLLYLTCMNLLAPIFAAPFLALKMRRQIRETLRQHKLEAFGVALVGSFAYGIVLWAFQRAQVSYVATLREFSVVIASVLGVLALKENLSARKTLGIAFILFGVAMIKLA